MKKLIPLILIVIFNVNAKLVNAQKTEDEKAVYTAVLDYVEGWYSADTVRMSKALPPNLKKLGFALKPKSKQVIIIEASYKQMIQWTGSNPNELKNNPDLKIFVEIIEIGNYIAMVKTISPDYIDYIHLGKIGGEWKIYNIIWEYNKGF